MTSRTLPQRSRPESARPQTQRTLPPGWYQDPHTPETPLFWDGQEWHPEPQPAALEPPVSGSRDPDVNSPITTGDPDHGTHYAAEMAKGSLNTTALAAKLNIRWKNGWRLAHVFEQKGATVLVFERR